MVYQQEGTTVVSDSGFSMKPVSIFQYRICSAIPEKRMLAWVWLQAEASEATPPGCTPPFAVAIFPAPFQWEDGNAMGADELRAVKEFMAGAFAFIGWPLHAFEFYPESWMSVPPVDCRRLVWQLNMMMNLKRTEFAKAVDQAMGSLHRTEELATLWLYATDRFLEANPNAKFI